MKTPHSAYCTNVYVHQDAKIQALGSRPTKWLFHSEEGGEGGDGGDGEEMTPVAPQTVSPPRPAVSGEVSEAEHTGTVLTFDCRNNEPPTNDDLNGGLSSVIS